MTGWFGVPAPLLQRLELAGLSRDDRLLVIEAFNYCSVNLTDGAIPRHLARISDAPDVEGAAARLLEAGVLSQTGSGYLVTDYFEANLERSEVERRQAQARDRKARWRRHTAGDHSMCDPVRCGGTRDKTRDKTREETPLHTAPTSPHLHDLTGNVGEGDVPVVTGKADSAAVASSAVPVEVDEDQTHAFVAAGISDDPARDTCTVCSLGRTNRRHVRAA